LIIDNLSYVFPSNKTVSIIGHSGCGKSTLLQIISGIIEPDNGTVRIENHTDRLGEIAYMQQKDLLLSWLTVNDNLLLPLKIKNKLNKKSHKEMIEKAKILGIYDYLEFYPKELSGGLKQRVAFLRTILQDSDFILLDEPFASLDAIKRIEIYNWIESLKDYINKSIILVTHDIEEALFLSDQIIVMDSGKDNFKFNIDINTPHPRKTDFLVEDKFIEQKKLLIRKLNEVKSLDR
tara:strand:- start:586 stop:1290 length:705 start_codon:yes stop_codon:yes gene_type:complete